MRRTELKSTFAGIPIDIWSPTGVTSCSCCRSIIESICARICLLLHRKDGIRRDVLDKAGLIRTMRTKMYTRDAGGSLKLWARCLHECEDAGENRMRRKVQLMMKGFTGDESDLDERVRAVLHLGPIDSIGGAMGWCRNKYARKEHCRPMKKFETRWAVFN